MSEVQRHEVLAEAAYEAMYDATSRHLAKVRYEDACGHFRRAITAARASDHRSEAARLEQRLAHIRTVYRHQFRWV